MSFDPAQPFEMVDQPQGAPSFDPSQPFEPVEPVNPVSDRLETLTQVATDKPDEAARFSGLAKKAGVTYDVAKLQADEIEKQNDTPDWREFTKKAPKTAQLLADDPVKLQITKPDVHVLADIEQSRTQKYDNSEQVVKKRAEVWPDEIRQTFLGLFMAGDSAAHNAWGAPDTSSSGWYYRQNKDKIEAKVSEIVNESDPLKRMQMAAPYGFGAEIPMYSNNKSVVNDRAIRAAVTEKLATDEWKARPEQKAWVDRTNILTDQAAFQKDLIAEKSPVVKAYSAPWVVDNVTQFGKNMITGWVLTAAGHPELAAAQFFGGVAGQEYADQKAQGATDSQAAVRAGVSGTIESVTEMIGLKSLEEVRLGLVPIIKGIGRAAGENAIQEDAAQIAHQVADALLEKKFVQIPDYIQSMPIPEPMKQVMANLDDQLQASLSGAVGSGALGSGGAGINTVHKAIVDRIEAREKAKKDQVVSGQAALLGEVKKVESMQATHLDKDTVGNVLDGIDGEDKRDLYVDPAQLLNQEGMTLEQIHTLAPSVSLAEINQALSVGGTVRVPRNELIVNLAATKELDNANISRHFKDSASNDSLFEMQSKGMDDQIKEADLFIKRSKNADELMLKRDEVYRQALNDLNDSGLGAGGNKQRAQLWASMATAMSVRMGMSPMDVYNELGSVRVGDGLQTGEGFNQLDKAMTGAVDPEQYMADKYAKNTSDDNLSPEATADIKPFAKTDRDVVSGMHTDRELHAALMRASNSNESYGYAESEVHNGGGINKKMKSDSKANSVIRDIGDAYSKAFEGAHVFHRGGWRFAAITPKGYDVKAAQARADKAMEDIIAKYDLGEIKSEKGGSSGSKLWHGYSEISQGKDVDAIIQPAQDVIKQSKPVEVSDVTRSKAIKAGLKSLSRQARGIIERAAQAWRGDQGTREDREYQARREAEGLRVDDSRAESEGRSGSFSGVQGENAAHVSPAVFASANFGAVADRHNLDAEQRKRYAPVINRDKLTGWFTNTDRALTVQRAKEWSKSADKKSTYVVMDISNLGGLNEGLGQHSADVVFRSMAYIMLKHANSIGADVIPFRHGGDEVSFVILGADTVAASKAMEEGKKDIQRYVNGLGLQNLPHLKDVKDKTRNGSGMYVGTIDAAENENIDDLLDDADVLVALNKEAGKPDVNGETLPIAGDSVFNQEQASPRGTYNPSTREITLLRNADLSTFLHESGHLFLDVMADFASREGASEGLRKDMDATLKWFGIEGDTAATRLYNWRAMTLNEQRQYHEKWAESFEQYLFEGKAPSLELRDAFRNFRQWLTHVYKSLARFISGHDGAKLNDEVRAVFDRMLATEEQIAEAEAARGMLPLFDVKPDNVTDAEWGSLKEQAELATQAAVEQYTTRSLRDMRYLSNAKNKAIRALQREEAELRHEASMEARKQVMSQPIYRAWQFLRAPIEGAIARNKKAKASEGVDMARDSLLTAIAKLGGLNKDLAASQFGIDPADYHLKGGVFGKPVLRVEGGLSPDAMAEALSQYGYMPLDENGKWDILDLDDMLRDEAAGDPHYSTQADYDVLLGSPYAAMPNADDVDFMGGRLSRQAIAEMYDDADLAAMQGGAVDTAGQLMQPAFHGSPYRFDKFSLEHMGKGEGAQAYGWGLYFAGNKDVAEYYRQALTKTYGLLDPDGKSVKMKSQDEGRALAFIQANGHDFDKGIADLKQVANEKPHFTDAIAIAERWKKEGYGFGHEAGKEGQLYKVDIPEDDSYLLWDRPLSEQPEKIQEAIEGAEYYIQSTVGNEVVGAFTGSELYRDLAYAMGASSPEDIESGSYQEQASKFLHSLGINGIKYLDGTSRSAGEGNYNYVIFDDNAVNILETFYQKGGKDNGNKRTLESMGVLSDDGLHPDAVASLFGLSSGDELIRKLMTLPDPVAEIARLTDEIMMTRHADLATPEAREQAAEAAIHNEARAKMLATELMIMNRAIGKPRMIMAAAKEFAANIVAGTKVRDLKPAQYESAEYKAGTAAERAWKAGDRNAAALQKRNQVLHNMTAKMMREAKDEIERSVKYLKKFDKPNKKIDIDYQEQIDTILERYDLRQRSLKQIERSKNLAQWMQEQKDMGLDPVIPDKLQDEANRTNYKDLTVEEMRGLVDAVKNIEHLGRLKNRLLTDRAKRELNKLADSIGESIAENGGAVKPIKIERNSTLDRLSDLASGFFSMHRKLASIVRQLDGWKDGGLFWETMIRPMNEAGDHEAVMHEASTMALAEVFAPLKGRKLTQKLYIPMIANSLSLEGRLAVALNWGNEGNRQRLMDGDKWGVGEVNAILATLTAEDWKFVQGVWDHIATYKDAIGAQQKRLTGIEPTWVDATPFEIKTADGQTVQVQGGYYPAKYDTTRSTQALSNEAAGNVFDQWKAAKGQGKTRDGFTKSRATQVKDRPIRKDFGVITQHITEVTHRLAWQDWVVDMNRLLKKEQVDSAIRAHYGNEILEEMRKALEDITTGDMTAQSSFEKAINHLRIGTTIVGLGYNLTTSLLQPFGLTQSIVRIGPKWVAKGLATWIGNPVRMNARTEEVYAKSDFMRLRGKTMMREMNEILNSVRKEKLSKIEASYFYGIQKMQIIADMPTWLGQYEKSMAEFDGDESKAIALADQAVLDAQGGGQNKDLARIQRGGPLLKLWTNFYSFSNTTYNLTRESIGRTDMSDPASVAKLGVDMLLLYAVPSAMGTLLKAAVMGGDDDDDELMWKLIRDEMSYLFGTMVGLREISAAFSGFNGYQGPAGTRFFSELAKLGKQAEQGEADAPFLKSLNNVGGILFHYPAGQINRTVEGANALMEGETDNYGALIFGKPR